jgi:hypothetical protein
MADEPKDENDLSMPDFPLTDETGDVDLSLLDSTLRLTPAQRAERHYHARLFAQRLQRLARERYGSTLDDLEATA